ncbi:GKAP1-like protein [Mya arenaria]|uniref:GKAP1-like protein n=1 Tax=Mya arenaria TaxID=6604 RepID=A0ABY7DJK0_MYAAR|nr:GKAP1-like protein [Mya arenaria]
MASIKVQQSRFALLKVEDDDSDDNSSKSTQRKGSANQTGGQKKKNKKKKHQQENEQLKHLAFGLPAKGHHGSAVVQNGSKPKRSTEQQWDEWQKVDEEQYAAESVITAKYQEQINKMEKEIEFLRATMKKQEGEMKDKAEVLMQVHQLTEVKDELTDQVADLTAELEKERSKLHAAKSEIEKLKGGKHK